jgi:hypothetical protein
MIRQAQKSPFLCWFGRRLFRVNASPDKKSVQNCTENELNAD